MARKKKASPAWVDKLLTFRKEISEDDYRALWKRLNKIRKDREAWNEEGQRIIQELEQEKEQPIFRGRDARRQAEVFQADNGGRILRRDLLGRFSTRGKTFQVIGSKK